MKFLMIAYAALLLTVGSAWGQGTSTTCTAPTVELDNSDLPSTYSAAFYINTLTGGNFRVEWRKVGGNWILGDSLKAQYYDFAKRYVQTGLQPGTTYEIRVLRQCPETSQSIYSLPFTFSTPASCPAPAGLTYQSSVLNWSTVTGASSVVEWRKFGQSLWTMSPVLNENVSLRGRSYLFAPNETGLYEWRAKAVCADGHHSDYTYGSAFSYNDCNETATAPEGEYILPRATSVQLSIPLACEGGNLEIRWRKQGETYWNLQCASDSAYLMGGGRPYTLATISRLTSNTIYEYQLGQLRTGRPPVYAAVKSFTTLASDIFPNGVICIGSTGAELSWYTSEAEGALLTYELQYRIGGTTSWTTLTLNSLTAKQYKLQNLLPDTAYEWRIRIVTPSQSNYSSISYFATTCIQPNIILAEPRSSGANFCTNLRITWNGCTIGTPFAIRYRPAGSSVWSTTIDVGEQNQYELTNLTTGTAYDVQVLASCPRRLGPVLGNIMQVTLACECSPLGAVDAQNITAQSVTLKWQSVPYNPFFQNGPTELRWRRAGTTSWNTIIVSAPIQEYNLRGLTDQTTYEWQVRAVCDAANAFTPIQVFRTVCNVPFSTRTKCITSSSALLTWKNAGGRTSYSIDWRPVGSTTWTTVSSLTTSSYELTGLNAGTAYEWRIRTACGTVATSPNGPTITFYTNVCSDRISSVKAGLWTDPATWSCGRVPLADDVVTVGHLVTVPANTTGLTRKLTFLGSGRLQYGSRARLQMRSL